MNCTLQIVPHIIRCVPIFFGSILLVFLSGCFESNVVPPTMEEIRAEQLPDQESWFARFDVLDGDKPRLQIHADYIAKYENPDSTYMVLQGHPDSLESRVIAYIFDEQGDSSATIYSNQMIYFEAERRFEALGNVLVLTQEQKQLETEYLIWMEVERTVNTKGFVRIISPTEQIQGYDLQADEDLENYEIARITGEAIVDDL